MELRLSDLRACTRKRGTQRVCLILVGYCSCFPHVHHCLVEIPEVSSQEKFLRFARGQAALPTLGNGFVERIVKKLPQKFAYRADPHQSTNVSAVQLLMGSVVRGRQYRPFRPEMVSRDTLLIVDRQ